MRNSNSFFMASGMVSFDCCCQYNNQQKCYGSMGNRDALYVQDDHSLLCIQLML
jgi:hypothetical protein